MSSIHEALKRAQQERERLRAADARSPRRPERETPPPPPIPPAPSPPEAAPPDAPLTAALNQPSTLATPPQEAGRPEPVRATVAPQPPPSLAAVLDLTRRAEPEASAAAVSGVPTPAQAAEAVPLTAPLSAAIGPMNAAMAPEAPAASAPLATALEQGEVSPTQQAANRVADTIVEDYETKRRLHLPAAMAVYHDRSGPAAEQYRRVRNALLGDTRTGPRLLVVTSSMPGEGKTTTVLNLGLSMVEIRALRVLLVDADLQHGRLSRYLQAQDKPGLSELIPGTGAPDDYLRATPWNHLYLLPAGAISPPKLATELIRMPHTRTLLHRLRNMFDVVLVDTPAALDCPDAGILGASSDGVLLTVGLHHTRRGQVQRTVRLLESLNLPLRGMILTRRRR